MILSDKQLKEHRRLFESKYEANINGTVKCHNDTYLFFTDMFDTIAAKDTQIQQLQKLSICKIGCDICLIHNNMKCPKLSQGMDDIQI